jgi:hypothetical protein
VAQVVEHLPSKCKALSSNTVQPKNFSTVETSGPAFYLFFDEVVVFLKNCLIFNLFKFSTSSWANFYNLYFPKHHPFLLYYQAS